MSEGTTRDLFGTTAEQACTIAIEKIGGPTAVSKALTARGVKLTPQAVDQWRVVPARHVRVVAELCHGEPSVHVLCPDVFGPAPEKAAA